MNKRMNEWVKWRDCDIYRPDLRSDGGITNLFIPQMFSVEETEMN